LLIDMMSRLGEGEGRDPDARGEAATPFRLVIAGDGPMAAALREDAARRAPGRVLFWGHVANRETLARLYATCDVFVHPNPREPFGIGPLEAMASGLPVVAPNAGGLLSYANNRNAWLCEPTGDAFAAAVRAVCEQSREREARVAAARETAAGYGWASVTRTIFDLYDALHARRVDRAGVETRGALAGPRDLLSEPTPSISRTIHPHQ
jgi:glycosyltransferase involved in cell wall biosynthesis